MGPSSQKPATPGEVLRSWQKGACDWLQVLSRTAQQLHIAGVGESSKVLEHLQRQQSRRQARTSRHGAFASLSASLPAAQPPRQAKSRLRFAGKGINCIVSDIADSALPNWLQNRREAVDSTTPNSKQEEPQESLLFSEIVVTGVDGALKDAAEQVLTMKPNFAYTFEEVSEDVEHIFRLGWFAKCHPSAEDTRDGMRLTIQLEANKPLNGVKAEGANVLPSSVIEDAFQHQYNQTLNHGDFVAGVAKINNWYRDRGLFGQVSDVDMEQDVVRLKMSEMLVGRMNLKYRDRKTGDIKDEGSTRPEVIMRQLCTKPGQVYSMQQAHRDIDAVYSMGLFDHVQILPQPAEGSTLEDPRMDLTLHVKERKNAGLSGGVGISAQGHAEGAMPGFIGSCSYSHRNLFGLNQKLSAALEAGQSDTTFRISHTDPWVRGDRNRTSRTISLQSNKTSGNLIHAKAQDEGSGAQTTGPEGNVKVNRLMAAVEYGRPLALHWNGTLGVNFQRANCLDDHNQPMTKDCYDAPLTFSRGPYDTMMLALLRCVYTGRNDSQVLMSMEQALPVHHSWLNFNRLRFRAERSIPLGFNQRLQAYLCGKGGAIIGDLPPYEAFPIGGTASVRGYGEGSVGSGRNYVAGTAELHFPLIAPVEGTLLFDYGSDLDSGASVLGDPAGVRGKPGNGWGYGAGIRFASPVGPLRLEYAWNREGRSRVHLGIGAHG